VTGENRANKNKENQNLLRARDALDIDNRKRSATEILSNSSPNRAYLELVADNKDLQARSKCPKKFRR
jgi:hypothetical protein